MNYKAKLLPALMLLYSMMAIIADGQTPAGQKFSSLDIGNPAISGTTDIQGDQISITAGGADVWGVRDEFRLTYILRKGDFEFTARMLSLTDPHLYTKAGLMAREDLSENGRHVFFQAFPNNQPRNKNNGGFEFQFRLERAGEMKAIYPERVEGNPEFPVNFPNTWIRLKREGNLFTGFTSLDGTTWKKYTAFTIDLPEGVYVGLAVTSHNTNAVAKVVFSEVKITP
jgi:hypothetical protein